MSAPGCVTQHSAFIYDRGGKRRLWPLNDMAKVTWNRVRDDISEATITIAAANCADQESIISQIRSIRHELAIFRPSDTSGETVRPWEGPITRIGLTPGRDLTIVARDVVHYTSRMNMSKGYNSGAGEPAIDRLKRIITTEYGRLRAAELAAYPDLPDYNYLEHIVYHQTPTDARTSRITRPFEQTVWEQLDSMAAKGGIDYTVVGRAIHIWDTSKPLGQLPVVTQADFLGVPGFTEYGMDVKTSATVTDGQGNAGHAGGVDPYYGLVENLETAYDESEGGTPPTSAEMQSQAQRNLVGGNPAPMLLRLPENSTVDPASRNLKVDLLVPGAHMPLNAKVHGRNITQMMKLDRVTVTETAAGESVSISASQAAKADEED